MNLRNLFGENNAKTSTKVVAGLVTLTVITLLLLAGPANAFAVSLGSFSDSSPKQGSIVSTIFNVNMNSNERANVSAISVLINGEDKCDFDASGNIISGCSGININKLSSSDAEYGYDSSYGYGYGYGYAGVSSKLSYNISFDTAEFALGSYIVQLNVATTNIGYKTSDEKTLLISSEGNADSVYSLDFKGDKTFNSSELNASISLVCDDNGCGGSIVIEEYSSAPANTSSFYLPGLNTYLIIDESGIKGGLSNDTEIRLYYSDADVAAKGIDESTLRLYYYNITAGSWTSPLSSGVNTTGNYVWAKTNHFSSWGAYGSSVSSSNSRDSGGGGPCVTEWNCSSWSSCNNGIQTRVCSYPTNYCKPINPKPLESLACTVKNNHAVTEDYNNQTVTQKENKGAFSSLFTGNVIADIFSGKASSIAYLIFLILALIIIILIIISYRKAHSVVKKEENKVVEQKKSSKKKKK